jgi:hypothetical protein
VEGIVALGTTFHDDVVEDGIESVGAVVVSTTVSIAAVESDITLVSDDDESDEHETSANAAMTIEILRITSS